MAEKLHPCRPYFKGNRDQKTFVSKLHNSVENYRTWPINNPTSLERYTKFEENLWVTLAAGARKRSGDS